MQPGQPVTVAPPFDDVPGELWAAIGPLYCRRATLVSVSRSTGIVESFPDARVRAHVPLQFIELLTPELFPQKGEGTRAALYLDQCILSQLVKHSRGEWSGRDAAATEVLSRALNRSVFDTESAICVESIFHQEESSSFANSATARGESIFSELWKFITLRARGLRLRSSIEIIRGQALQRSALREGGQVMRRSRLWSLGLSRDPQETNTRTGVLGRTIVAGVHWQPLTGPLGYSSQLELERASKQFGSREHEYARTVDAMRRDAIDDNRVFSWSRRWGDDSADAPSSEAVLRTLLANEFHSLPYVDCKSALVGSLLSEPKRKFKDSDHNDVQFASRALPYCHMMMVDGDLRNRITSLKLDTRYRTKVCSASLNDYCNAATWLADLDKRAATASA
jgi:hypothetical protein